MLTLHYLSWVKRALKLFIFLLQSYMKTSSSGEKFEWNLTVAGRNVHFSIVDLGGEISYL